MALEYTKTAAIVSHSPIAGKGQWNIEDIDLPPAKDNEVVVQLVAAGVCNIDLAYSTSPDGTQGFPYPRIHGF